MKLVSGKTKFILPNLITLGSVFCGFDAIRTSASAGSSLDYYRAATLLVFALICDVMDGRVARLTKTESAFGMQMDSLADVISFGVAPAMLIYKLSLHQLGQCGLLVAFTFAGMGAVRLARFNVLSATDHGHSTGPSKYFVGLPVPAAAGIVISIVMTNHALGGDLAAPRFAWPLAALTLLLSALMVSEIGFRTFKRVSLNAQSFALGMAVMACALGVALLATPSAALTCLLALYVLAGIGETLMRVWRKSEGKAGVGPLPLPRRTG